METRWLPWVGATAAVVAAVVAVLTYLLQPVPFETEQVIRDDAEQWRSVEPPGGGPWNMKVVAGSTAIEVNGLKVMSSATDAQVQIGTVPDRANVVAVCRIDLGFDPFPGQYPGYDSEWFGIRWPTQGPGRAAQNSSRNDRYVGYVWSGAVVAQGTNGHFPTC